MNSAASVCPARAASSAGVSPHLSVTVHLTRVRPGMRGSSSADCMTNNDSTSPMEEGRGGMEPFQTIAVRHVLHRSG